MIYGLQHPNGRVQTNCVETSEPWVWALMYSRQRYKEKIVHPSKVPPDFITAAKQAGFRVVELRPLDLEEAK